MVYEPVYGLNNPRLETGPCNGGVGSSPTWTNMIENIDNKIGELVNEVGTNEAITFVKNIINHCLLALNGLYVHKGHKNYAKKVLEDGLPFAQDSRLYAAMAVVLIREDRFGRSGYLT